ncbi:MAG TPA: hypothetical protein DCZ95_04260 [Verrucomicrobia bacterium]|nr:hypothetical protein [Verrucomicrobiota bacterium]
MQSLAVIEMKYIEVKTGSWKDTPLPWWCRLLQRIIPPANPDYERFYPALRTWWVELDDKEVPTREIGFDADGNPIVLAPFGRNCGFIVDTSTPWNDAYEECLEAKAKFQATWKELEKSFSELKQ